MSDVPRNTTLLTQEDLYLFNEGTHNRLYERLGAHPRTADGATGYDFAVWAPNADAVSVFGDFNEWSPTSHPLARVGDTGIWEGFVPGVRKGMLYKFRVTSRGGVVHVDKADPFGYMHEVPPATASIAWTLEYDWGDAEWLDVRAGHSALSAPMSVYEVHLGSWRRRDGESLSYREIAEPLAAHVKQLGFTHIELMPIMEHPFYGSWGYQSTGYFAPTSRHGTPQDFMYLMDYLHQQEVGVILDWVPSHFPGDAHGLYKFDGTHLFEHEDPRQGFHPDWSSYIFNYGRHEVRSFLLSSALFWMDVYHADGLRVDAVASMLYLDYSRKQGAWIPNKFGGRENLEAIEFLRRMNTDIYGRHGDTQTIAEESTAWPMVSRPTYVGGLGFGMKWDMGWMHDSLDYFSKEPIHRRYHHGKLTFRGIYAYTENFLMPLSHDEVVHGKGSLINKMPGDEWRKFANLRLLYGYMYTQPGKKLLFMGAEIAQYREWNHDGELDWTLLQYPLHQGMVQWVTDLNAFYRNERAAHVFDNDPMGFEWIDADDALNSVLSWIRKSDTPGDLILVVCNCTPLMRTDYRIGVPEAGFWEEILNSDAETYGGSGVGNYGGVESEPIECHGRPHSLGLTLPPLGMTILKLVATT
ncbi:MAG: 1,4-alpha-glucan branching protein GlgB [Longimicrobiales bacterium]